MNAPDRSEGGVAPRFPTREAAAAYFKGRLMFKTHKVEIDWGGRRLSATEVESERKELDEMMKELFGNDHITVSDLSEMPKYLGSRLRKLIEEGVDAE